MFPIGGGETAKSPTIHRINLVYEPFYPKISDLWAGIVESGWKGLKADTLEITAHTVNEQNRNDSHNIPDLAVQDHF
jgi:hypothetical protein